MSGRSIGTAIGFAVGLFFPVVGTALGATLGGMIGGAISPDKVKGATIGELPIQRSLTGGIQPVVLGTSLVDQCLIMWAGTARIVKEKEQQGKGGGPVVINEVLYQDYRIRVCRSSAADGSQVEGFPMIFEDGRLVYDTRPSPRISAADSAKWAQNVVFYYGGPAQEPDPTEEADVGVGNASAHRQIASFVKVNQKMTDFGNRVPTYEVVVSRCGVEGGGGGGGIGYLLVTGSNKTGDDKYWCQATAGALPTFTTIAASNDSDMNQGLPGYYDGHWLVINSQGVWHSIDNRVTFDRTAWGFGFPEKLIGGDSGWMATNQYLSQLLESPWVADLTPDGFTLAAAGHRVSEVSFAGGQYWHGIYRSVSPYGPWVIGSESVMDVADFDGAIWGIIRQGFDGHDGSTSSYSVRRSTDGGATWSAAYMLRGNMETFRPVQLCAGDDYLVAWCFGGGVWSSANGWASPIDTGISGAIGPVGLPDGGDSLKIEGGRQIAFAGRHFFTIERNTGVGGSIGDKCVSSPDGITWSAPITMPISSAYGIVASSYEPPIPIGPDIPDAPGFTIDPITGETSGPSLGESSLCGTTLAEVVRYICNRGQLEDAELYLTELENIPVRGVTLQSPGTCKDELDPLRQAHFFDPADFDSKLRFRVRGTAAVDLTINPDDLVFTEDDEEQNRIIGQEVDLSRKHLVNYLSLDLDYLRTSAPHEFTTLDPSVVGTSETAINEVFSHEEASKIGAIQHELLRMGNEGYRKFGLPMEYLPLVGASLVTLNGRRGRIDGQSIDLNAIWFDPVPYDRARAYEANVVAPVLTPPTGPGTTIKGPTDSILLNVPVLRDADDKPGIYWAPRGFPNTAWDGAILQVLRDGVWLEVDQATRACNTGTLLSDLPANDGPIDEVHTLQIRLSGGMDSITFAQFLNEGNPIAIQYPDGKAEILQAQFATEISDGVYDCTRLIRGRLDTVNGEHLAGARVVFLNNDVRFVQVQAGDIGKTLSYRAVSNGTDPAMAEVQTITLASLESQREWQPYNVTSYVDADCQTIVEFIGRARLGTDANPVQSQWWTGWRIDFIAGGVTKSRMTQSQRFVYTAEMQIEDFGSVRCAGYTTAVTSVNEYTGGDGAGGAGTGETPDEQGDVPLTDAGALESGYVGIPYFMYLGVGSTLGLRNPDPRTLYGGYYDGYFNGAVVTNVVAEGGPRETFISGIPVATSSGLSGAVYGYTGKTSAGTVALDDAITIAAKPTYTLPDWSGHGVTDSMALVSTTPTFTTAKLGPSADNATGGLLSWGGVTTGTVRGEFIVTGLAGGYIWIGVHASSASAGITGYTPGIGAYRVTADGAYAVELNATTGAYVIRDSGGSSVASGTLTTALSYDGKYRLGWGSDYPNPNLVIKSNYGNEAWAITPTGGYTGFPAPTTDVGLGWDTAAYNAANYRFGGRLYTTSADGGSSGGSGLIVSRGGFSSGKHRVALSYPATGGTAGVRVGLFKSGGTLGVPGVAANSLGFRNSITEDRNFLIEWNFGTPQSLRIDDSGSYGRSFDAVFAIDQTAGTVDIWVSKDGASHVLVATIPGLPAGTWLAAAYGVASRTLSINALPAIPATFDNWTQQP